MSAIQEALEKAKKDMERSGGDGSLASLSWTIKKGKGRGWMPATVLLVGLLTGVALHWMRWEGPQRENSGRSLRDFKDKGEHIAELQASITGVLSKKKEVAWGNGAGAGQQELEDTVPKELKGLGRAHELRLKGEISKAKRELLLLLSQGVRTPRVLSALADLYLTDLGRPQEAVRLYKEALEMSPDDVGLRVNLSVAYLKSNQLKKAEEELSVALRAKPEMVEALYNMACIKAIQGKREEARGLLARAARIDQRVLQWAREDPDLANLREIPKR